MLFEIHPPAPPLRDSIRCYWTLRGAPEGPPQPVFPDGSMELVFQLAEPMIEGGHTVQPRQLLVGQMLRPTLVSPAGRVDTFGIRFRPQGAAAFFRMPLHWAEDRILALDEVWGRQSSHLAELLAEAPSLDARLSVVNAFLLTQRKLQNAAPALDFALRRLSQPGAQIAAIARNAGVSLRHLQRTFREQVGTSPKAMLRILRFQRALRALHAPWADVAASCGYFDQAHLIHDFREFTGLTPTQFRASQVAFLQDLSNPTE